MLLDFFTTLATGYLVLVGLWFIALFIVLVTLFRRKDILLPVRILWGVLIFIAPVLGLIVYLFYGLPKRRKLLEKTR